MGTILANEANNVRDRVNRVLSRVGKAQTAGTAVTGSRILASLFDTYKTGLVNANASPKVSPKANLSSLTYAQGAVIRKQVFDDAVKAADTIYNNYCSCDCNYCSCNCDYCSCDCDNCPCDCDVCSCDCNNCSCVSDYCSCDCNNCYCDCDYCRCDCDNCACDCNYCGCEDDKCGCDAK